MPHLPITTAPCKTCHGRAIFNDRDAGPIACDACDGTGVELPPEILDILEDLHELHLAIFDVLHYHPTSHAGKLLDKVTEKVQNLVTDGVPSWTNVDPMQTNIPMCPVCDADEGSQCSDETGKEFESKVHTARLNANPSTQGPAY